MEKDIVDTQRELAETVDEGVSERTPWILLGEVWVVAVVAFLTILAVVLFAYRVA